MISELKLFDATEQVKEIKRCGCASGSCKSAKKIKCACSCHSVYHGIRHKSELRSLDDHSREDPVPFDAEQYLEELAVLM